MIQDGLLCAKRLAEVLLKLSNMKNTLEFEIPDGYELDKEESTAKKAVYKKVEKYEPKEGDLVVSTHIAWAETNFISLWDCDPDITPCVFRSVAMYNDWIFLNDSTCVFGDEIRPATAEEAALFTRILDENGYEYDMVKKEVRKKRWRAEKGKCYWYVSIYGGASDEFDDRYDMDNELYNLGNYFRTREEAEEVAAEFRKILRNRKASGACK